VSWASNGYDIFTTGSVELWKETIDLRVGVRAILDGSRVDMFFWAASAFSAVKWFGQE
jgi:hypothetical protein